MISSVQPKAYQMRTTSGLLAPTLVFARTKQHLADRDYTARLMWYPQCVARVRLPGFAAKRELSKDFQDNILKHCPALRSYGLADAADHLEAWVAGSLELEEPLDISGCRFGCDAEAGPAYHALDRVRCFEPKPNTTRRKFKLNCFAWNSLRMSVPICAAGVMLIV
eukprot:s1098_g4.t1